MRVPLHTQDERAETDRRGEAEPLDEAPSTDERTLVPAKRIHEEAHERHAREREPEAIPGCQAPAAKAVRASV